MSWRATTMPGVLIDESEADDSTRALFYAAETPTQADVIKTAHWLGVDPLQHAFNLDLDFATLEPGDLSALGYTVPTANLDDDDGTAPYIRRDPLEAIALVLMYGASGIFMCMAAGYIWARWFS